MEAICSSKTSVATQQTTRRHIPEEDTLRFWRCFLTNNCINIGFISSVGHFRESISHLGYNILPYIGSNSRTVYCRAYVATIRDGVWIVNWMYWISIQIHSITVYTRHNWLAAESLWRHIRLATTLMASLAITKLLSLGLLLLLKSKSKSRYDRRSVGK
jgi:hypothetical protein